jgi:hypothetical protein
MATKKQSTSATRSSPSRAATRTPKTAANKRTTAKKAARSAAKSPARPSPPALMAGQLVTKGVDLAVDGIGTARHVLDRRGGLPAYVGTGALAVVGVLEWPVAVGVGAGYAALRRWGPSLPEPLRSLTGSREAESDQI